MHDSSDSTAENFTADAPENRADEIDQLRERLAFYESFDQLIHENISRAGDLLREAAAQKSQGELAIRSATAEVEQRQLEERIGYRKIFSGLLDEITTVQQNVERLARQVSDALDDLEAVIPAAGESAALEGDQLPSMPTFSSQLAGQLGAGAMTADEPPVTDAHEPEQQGQEAPEAAAESGAEPEFESDVAMNTEAEFEQAEEASMLEPVDELYPEDSSHEPVATHPGTGPLGGGATSFSEVVQASVDRVSQDMGGVTAEAEPELAEAPGLVEIESMPEGGVSVDIEAEEPAVTDTEAAETEAPEPEVEPVEAAAAEDEWDDAGPSAATTVLVHGVPRATTALSLKRYLEGLAQVHSVEPREYAEGILRLQVASDRPVGLDDLRGWPEGNQLEPVSISDEFVEVRLTQ
jgi:hypothetical protein